MQDDKKILLDEYDSIVNRLGFGRYQVILFLVIGSGLYADGIETVLMSLLSYIFMDLWGLSSTIVALHASSVFLGKSLGICFSGLYGDDLGRLKMTKLGLFLISISYILAPLMPEFYTFICSRLIGGAGIGLMIPVFGGYLMENVPISKKAMSIVTIMAVVPIGQLIVIVIFFIICPNLDNHYWRLVFPIICPYIFLSTYLAYFYLKESPMFLLKQGHILQAIDALNYIAVQNKKNELEAREVDMLHSAMMVSGEEGFRKIKVLFTAKYSRITSLMLVVWYSTQIVYFGFFIILPESLSFSGENKEVLIGWFIAALVQMPFHMLNAYFTSKLGSRNMMMISGAGLIVFEAMSIFLVGKGSFYFCVVGLTACGVILFSANFAYTSQAYEASVRSLGTGFFNIICNVTGIVTPLIIYRLNDIDSSMPYVLMLLLACVCFLASLALPKTIQEILNQKMF